jgi:GGDEF domain-containing protein
MSELIFDELTGLMTPYHFYESARRIRSWAERKDQALSLIAIRIPEMSDDALVECARSLNNELRGGDLLARMGERVFVLLLVGDEVGAGHLVFRLSNIIKPKLSFTTTFLSTKEEITAGLDRLGI